MNENTEEFMQGEFRGLVMGKLEALKISYEKLESMVKDVHEDINQFRNGIGLRTEKHGEDISALKIKMRIIWSVLATIGAPILAVIGYNILKK